MRYSSGMTAWQQLTAKHSKPVIGMVHLQALPGAPGHGGDLREVIDAAVRDAEALVRGGVSGVMVENFGDVPFFRGRVPAETVAAATAVAQRVRDAMDAAGGDDTPIGINMLRNDVRSALAVAHAVGAAFVRCNVLVGAYVTDQGVIEGEAAEVLRYRQALGAVDVAVWADVRVKHAAPLAERPLEVEAEELVARASAEALIVSGEGTGKPTDTNRLQEAKRGAGEVPVLVGSGATAETLPALSAADGWIVGTHFKDGGDVAAPVDPARVAAFVEAAGA